MAKKPRTRRQVKTAQERAIRAAEDLLEDFDLADELASLTPEEYAERRHFEIVENRRRPPPQLRRIQVREVRQKGGDTNMPSKAQLEQKISDLEQENSDLEEENSELQDTLDQIFDLAAPVSEEEEEEGDGGEEE